MTATDDSNRYHVLFVALDELGRKAMCEATCEAESESAARQCWIDSAAGEDALLALAYVDPVTSTGIVRCRDLGPVVERTVVESPFKPDVTVDDRVVNEVCDNCGSPLVVVRSREGRFCTSECAEAFELS